MIKNWKEMTCGDCWFHFVKVDRPGAVGICRRFPPSVVAMPHQQKRMVNGRIEEGVVMMADSHYPSSIKSTPACGEFEQEPSVITIQ